MTLLIDGNRQVKVRLHGIDAPELGQPFGQASTRAVSDLACFALAACCVLHDS
jgi:endonuclease YncB( thermonuclease family)